MENYWPCTVEPNVDLSIFLRELVFFSLFKTFLLLIMSQILAPFGEWCINGLYTQRSFWGSTSQTLCAPGFSQGNQHSLPTPHHHCDHHPYCPSLTHATSPCLLFSLPLAPYLLSQSSSRHCLESVVCVEKMNKIRHIGEAAQGASCLPSGLKSFRATLYSCRQQFSQPRGLVTIIRTWFDSVPL